MKKFNRRDYNQPLTKAHYEWLYTDRAGLGKGYTRPWRRNLWGSIAKAVFNLWPQPDFGPGHASTIENEPEVLEAACGPGLLLQYIQNLLPTARCTGFDFAESAIKWAKENAPSAKLYVADLWDFEPAGPADFVLAIQLLEHLYNPSGAMKRFMSWCKPGGYVIVTVPNGPLDCDGAHVHHWSKAGLNDWLRLYDRVKVRPLRKGATLMGIVRQHESTPT